MGFSAGIMLSASSFSLINPALGMAKQQLEEKILAAALVGAAILGGVLFLYLCDRFVPHEHFVSGREGVENVDFRRIWLFVFAIALHNFPEGLAVGSGVGSQSLELATPIVVGIGLQDLPEGFVVALSLMSVGYSRLQSLSVAVLTGVVEAGAALIGFMMTTSIHPILPWTLAFAGGAMVYVVIDEMIPEMKGKSSMREGSFGFMMGFVLMMFLDTALAF